MADEELKENFVMLNKFCERKNLHEQEIYYLDSDLQKISRNINFTKYKTEQRWFESVKCSCFANFS